MNIIISVTSDGISYINQSGLEGYIDFKQCNENYIQYVKRTESLNDEEVIELRKNIISVGQRDICAKPQFIEFFTKPFTKLEFVKSDEYPDTEKAFSALQNDIINAGWTTLDLS